MIRANFEMPASGCDACGKYEGAIQSELHALLVRESDAWLCMECGVESRRFFSRRDDPEWETVKRPLTARELQLFKRELERQRRDTATQALRAVVISTIPDRWVISLPWRKVDLGGKTLLMDLYANHPLTMFRDPPYFRQIENELLEVFQAQFESHQDNSPWVFPGDSPEGHLSPEQLQDTYTQVLRSAGVSYCELRSMAKALDM